MPNELSLALVQADAVASPDEFGGQIESAGSPSPRSRCSSGYRTWVSSATSN